MASFFKSTVYYFNQLHYLLYFFFGVLVGGFIVAIMCFSLSISTTRDCPMYYYTYYCDYPAGYHPLTSTGVREASLTCIIIINTAGSSGSINGWANGGS
jgi:hypothetical protein